MALNELIQAQLEEKVENGWLTKEQAKLIWERRQDVAEVIQKLYDVHGESLSLDKELDFVDRVFTLALTVKESLLQAPALQNDLMK